MLGEFFDRKQSFSIQEHCRPHWSQAGAVVFITLRANDSIPREVVIRWEREKKEWLRQRGLLTGPKIEAIVANLPPNPPGIRVAIQSLPRRVSRHLPW